MVKRLISFICALALVSTAISALAFDEGIGTVYMKAESSPSVGLDYGEIYANNKQGKQIAYTYTYTPGGETDISIGITDGIYGRATASAITEYEISRGKNVVGAVNGNSFSIQSGVPYGTHISDGSLLTYNSADLHDSVGINKDGSIINGSPDISLSLTYNSKLFDISAVNCWPSDTGGICLMTDRFASSTKSIGIRTEIVLKPTSSKDITLIDQSLSCTVTSISSTPNTDIPQGHIVISATTELISSDILKNVKIGDKITINAASERWKNVCFAIGTDKMIIKEGAAVSGNENTYEAKTAVGIKNDGKLLFFSCDGDGTYGKGLTTSETVNELLSYGVKTAYYLDCGESVTVTDGSGKVLNHPSDGNQRPIGNAIVFHNTAKGTEPSKLQITPSTPTVLKQGFVRLSCEPVDASGSPTGHALTNINYSLSSTMGTVSGSLFKAGASTGNVTLTAKAVCGDKTLTGTTVISIIASLDNIKAEKTTVYVPAGGRADIEIKGIRSSREVYIYGYFLKWSFTGVNSDAAGGAVARCKYGYLDNNMVFHAEKGHTGISFTLNAKYGNTTIPITIIIGRPEEVISDFDDTTLAFSSYLKTDSSQSYAYTQGKFQTSGMKYNGKSIVYKTMRSVDHDAEGLSLWLKGTAFSPYAVVEINGGIRSTVSYQCTVDHSDYNGWKKYALKLPDDTVGIISPLSSASNMNCVIDEVTVNYDLVSLPFTDIASSWAKSEIQLLYELDVTAGYGVKGKLYYSPQKSITRAEFTKMIVTYYGIDINKYKNTPLDFCDASSIPSWALPYVKAAVAEGIINGSSNPDGSLSFLPSANITRAQVATMIGRRLTCSPTNINFTDKADIPSYALNGLMKSVSAGVLSGYPDGSFKPGNDMTRAEVAKILTNLYKYSYQGK